MHKKWEFLQANSFLDGYYQARVRRLLDEDMESSSLSGQEFAVRKLQDSCKVICKEFGFTSVSQQAINKLAAILKSKINEYAHLTRLFVENTGRSHAIVEDVMAAFKYLNLNVIDIRDYAKQVRCERLKALPIFPVPDTKMLSSTEAYFLAMYGPPPSQRELAERPAHIPPYMRALHPEWIEEERIAKEEEAKKTAADREQEEFERLKKINSYRRAQLAEGEQVEEKEMKLEEEYELQQQAAKGSSLLPSFDDMDYHSLGFFEDHERAQREEAERQEAAARIERIQMAYKPAVRPSAPTEVQQPSLGSFVSTIKLGGGFQPDSAVDPADTNSFVREWCNTLPQHFAPGSFTSPEKYEANPSHDDAGPVFRMSDLVKPIKFKISGTGSGSQSGSAPTSRPGSAMSNTTTDKRFGPGRPKKIKPENNGPPKPKGRPPKKATLEKRKLQNDLLLAQQQNTISVVPEEKAKSEKPVEKVEEKAAKKEKSKKLTIDEKIRDQILRAKNQMLLPNSALPPEAQPSTSESIIPAPKLTAQVTIVPEVIAPDVGVVVDIEAAPILFEEPAMEIEIKTDDHLAMGPSSSEIPLESVSLDKPKKEKRDKNSEEYKEYKRQKKEKRRKEREERKIKDDRMITGSSTTEETPNADPTQNPKLTLKIKLGNHYSLTQENSSPMRPDSTNSTSRPASSRSYHEDPPPPANPPIKFRFKNFFNLTEEPTGEDTAVSSSTPHGSRPGSSLLTETPYSSSSKHHKKDRKDKEKKHKKEKERDREKEREREERKERERQQKQEEEAAARREIEEKARLEMEEQKRREEKERRREEKRKEKERKREKDEKRERKEKEREREQERERERERERDREKIREKERERERKEEKRKEEERKKKEKRKSTPPPVQAPPVVEAPIRPLIQDDESDGSESSEEIWICPVCSVAYSTGANMVCCDNCQEWFHWHCVGLTEEPKDAQWFCNRCSKGNKKKKQGSKRSAGPGESHSAKRRKH